LPTETSDLISSLIAGSVADAKSAIGVIVRDIPTPRLQSLLDALAASGATVHISYLLDRPAEELDVPPNVDLVFDVEAAERWRNERDLDGLIVVIAHGDEPKLSSLEEFASVTPKDLKADLVRKAQSMFAPLNEVQGAWWTVIGKDPGFSLVDMLFYFKDLEGLEGADLKFATVGRLPNLGLLSDPDFFASVSPSALKSRVDRHRDVRTRVRALSPSDRVLIKNSIDAEKDEAKQKSLQATLQILLKSRWSTNGDLEIGLEDAEKLLKAKSTKSTTSGGTPPRKRTIRADTKAAEALVSDSETDKEEALATLEQLRSSIEASGDNGSLKVERARVRVADGAVEVVSEYRTDVVSVVGKFLTATNLGGFASVDADDIQSLLRKFNPNDDIVRHWDETAIEKYIAALERNSVGLNLRPLFESYTAIRADLLPQIGVLTSEPLLAMTDATIRERSEALIAAYESFVNAIDQGYASFYEVLGSEMEDLSSQVLLLDIILLETPSQPIAILSPLHPLYLWPYATFARNVNEQRDRLSDDDLDLVAEVAPNLPNFVGSLFIPQVALGAAHNLNAIGKVASLPVYAMHSADAAVENATGTAISDLIRTFLAFEPHAASSLRIALIDDPSIGEHLREIVDLNESGILLGAHVLYYRSAHEGGINLALPEDDEDRVSQLFSALSKSRRFAFETVELEPGELPDTESFHLSVVFDRSGVSQKGVTRTQQPIQPLTLPRRLRFKVSTETVELEPTPGGVFASYDALAQRASSGTRPSYLEVHQQTVLRDQLASFMAGSSWVSLMDRSIDRDLQLGATRVLSRRYGQRDLAVFARSADAFRRPLRDVVRQYNAYVNEDQLDDLLAQLSILLDSGLSTLLSETAGIDSRSRTKGLLGTLIAAKWYREVPGADRILASLDGEDARRWMLRADDSHRADLLGMSWENDELFVDVIEVKAVDQSAGEYKIQGGNISGSAVEQLLATHGLLSPVFDGDRTDELMTTPARREILREHLFRELSKPAYDASSRQLWAGRIQQALEGELAVRFRCRLVDVQIGAQTSTLSSGHYATGPGQEAPGILLTQLNEDGIAALSISEGTAASDVRSALQTEVLPNSVSRHSGNAVNTMPTTLPPTAEAAQARPRVFLGTSRGTYGAELEAWYDPALPSDPLPNPHLSITGETGSGKTQATKSLISELGRQGIPSLVFDFKDDYSTEPFVTDEGFRLYDASYEGLPFNPLQPPSDPVSGRTNVAHYVHQISEILKRIYKLGDQQAYRLREGLKVAYQEVGVPWNASTFDPNWTLPSFESLQRILAQDKSNDALLGRLSPIFDLGLFATSEESGDLATFLGTPSVIRLSQLPGDEVKNAVAEFFLMAVYNHLIREPQSHRLQRLMILDEAWRLVESPFLIPLMREGRAFGLGVAIATQFPRDLPEEIRGSTATRLYFSQSQAEQIREIQRTVLGRTSGTDADALSALVRSLAPLTCILHNKQNSVPVKMEFKAYFERLAEATNGQDPEAD